MFLTNYYVILGYFFGYQLRYAMDKYKDFFNSFPIFFRENDEIA
jgi:hypothetical protein